VSGRFPHGLRMRPNRSIPAAVVIPELAYRDVGGCHRVMVRVADVDAHHRRAVAHGARILSPPTDYPFGERRYSLADPAGHRWVFPQSIADADPAAWGGQLQP